MPLMKPEVQKILRAAGLAPEASEKDSRDLSELLDAAGLSKAELLEEIAILVKSTGNDALRLRAAELALKAHGALKETAPAAPSFTIVIQENVSSAESTESPQAPAGVNPILLPRQLLKNLPPSDKIQ